jgi:hypothetical protein
MPASAITADQVDYVRGIQRRLKLPDRLMDDHCVKRFGKPLRELTKREGSALLEEIIPWQQLPAEMQRAMGQLDLF